MDETENATSLFDSSGNGRHTTLGEGVSIVEGRFGKAARFDGTTGAWAQTTLPSFSNLTVATWMFVEGEPTNPLPRILQLAGNFFYHTPSNNLGTFTFGNSTIGNEFNWKSDSNEPFRFPLREWFHAAVVINHHFSDNNKEVFQATFYLNGLRAGNPSAETDFLVIPAGTATIGSNGMNASRPLQGMLDDFRIYDTPLSDREILNLYQHSSLVVDAGSDQTLWRTETLLLGRLDSTNSFMRTLRAATEWSVVSAPNGATPLILTPDVPTTKVSLPEVGQYTFRLSANNDLGTFFDEVTITRLADAPVNNSAPSVTPRWISTNVVLGTAAPLAATVTDDDTPGALRLHWTKVSGPGATFFENAFTNETVAYFTTNGTYIVQLEADDGDLQNAATITVNVTLPVGDLSNGLLHWWRMDDDPTLGKVSDSMGTNSLTLQRSGFLQPGITGNGYRGALTNSCAVADSIPPNADQMTFTAWMYSDEAYVKRAEGNIFQRLYRCGSNFYISYNPELGRMTVATRDSDNIDRAWNSPEVFTANRWIHVSVLIDRRAAPANSRQTFYVDGVAYESGALSAAFSGAANFTSPFAIGNSGTSPSANRNFDGVLDEMRIYNRFITADEAQLLAANPSLNHAPIIKAPTAVTAKTGVPLANIAAVFDDERPLGTPLTTRWSVIQGNPTHVDIDDVTSPASQITFTKSGTYILRLDADDGEHRVATTIDVTSNTSGTTIILL